MPLNLGDFSLLGSLFVLCEVCLPPAAVLLFSSEGHYKDAIVGNWKTENVTDRKSVV